MATQIELRQNITNQIVEALRTGGVPIWRRPWRLDGNAGFAANVVSQKPYRGVNILLLEMAAMRHGLQSRWWATFNQWKQLGGKVMKRPVHVPSGSWGTQIVFWSPVVKKDTDQNGDEIEDKFFVMRQYTVFNVDQVEGPFDHLRVGGTDTGSSPAPEVAYQRAEDAIAATKADIRYGGSRAFCSLDNDYIQLPHRETFTELDEFYQSVFHELVHWTEHPKRLHWNRKGEGYAMGELIAELGACFLARELGVPCSENLTNHAAYLQTWLRAMEGDSNFIFQASSQASKAADFILAFSRTPDPNPQPEPDGVLVG